MTSLIDFIFHIDRYLVEIVHVYQAWTYLILFLVIFAETGLVVTPFLPGDSVLFAVGALIAKPETGLSLGWMYILLATAAVTGDFLNYEIGKRYGKRLFNGNFKLFKPAHLQKTTQFYEKHGPKTIVYARFIPIVRTFAPFVAGIVGMSYSIFGKYNIFGALLWISLFLIGGYFFGQIPWVEQNFSVVVLVVILFSLIPAIIEIWNKKRSRDKDLNLW